MTDQANLERAYQRLLAWYPREFRQDSGQEFLGVLMASARDGQRRPGLAESADLIRSGLWMRLRPRVPRSARTVRAAVRFMYAGAAVSTAELIILLAVIVDIEAYHAVLGHRLSAAQVSHFGTPAIAVPIVLTLAPVVLWLWMARANGQGRHWARTLSTVLFGLATLSLSSAFPQSVINLSFVPTIHIGFGPAIPLLTWLAGAAAVWLLWRPSSSAYFRPPGSAQAQYQAQMMARLARETQMAEVARIRARMPRRV